MVRADVFSGICGFTSVGEGETDSGERKIVRLSATIVCPSGERLGLKLPEVHALRESIFGDPGPRTLEYAGPF